MFKFLVMDSPVIAVLVVVGIILFIFIEFAVLRFLFIIGNIKKHENIMQGYNSIYTKISTFIESEQGYKYTINSNSIDKLLELYMDNIYGLLTVNEINSLKSLYGDAMIGLEYMLSQYLLLNKRTS